MTNESAILGILADLYQRNAALLTEIQQLRAEVTRLMTAAPDATARRRRR